MYFLANSLGRVAVPSPKIVQNIPRTYKKLHCKKTLSVQRLTRFFRYRQIKILLLFIRIISTTYMIIRNALLQRYEQIICNLNVKTTSIYFFILFKVDYKFFLKQSRRSFSKYRNLCSESP